MSRAATDWAWKVSPGSATLKLILLSMADRADEYHQCYPSIRRLEGDTCLNRKTIQAGIKRLEEIGLIVDTGMKKGPTQRVRVLQLQVGLELNDPNFGNVPKNGTLNDPNFGTLNDPNFGTQNQSLEPVIEPVESTHAATTQNQADRIPYEQIRKLYNEILGPHLGRCMGVNEKHRKGIRGCYNLKLEDVYPFRQHGIEFWRSVFSDVLECKFLLGQNGRSWRADFEFLTKAGNIQKFLEGKYDNAA